jgi:hypothetical protein
MNLEKIAKAWLELCWLIDVNAACAHPDHMARALVVSDQWKKTLYGEDGVLWQ